MEEKRLKRMALLGFLGGFLFAIGDVLTYLLPNYHNGSEICRDWADMNMNRLAASLYLGCLGSGLLLVGFYSLYQIVKQKCSKAIQAICMLVAFGIVLTGIGHFCIACIVPMTYKGALSSGATVEMAQNIAIFWETYVSPLKVFIMVVVILIQSVLMIFLILKGRIECPKWMILLNPVGLILLSIPLSILLNGTGVEGVTEASESLGEACMYLAVYVHWQSCNKYNVVKKNRR